MGGEFNTDYMTKKEAKIKMLITMWGWATNHCENIEDGQLSDVGEQDVRSGRYSQEEATLIQYQYFLESKRILVRLKKLRVTS